MNMDHLNQVSEFRCCQQNNLKFSEDIMKFQLFDFIIISSTRNNLNGTVDCRILFNIRSLVLMSARPTFTSKLFT